MITFDEEIEKIPYEKTPISIKEQVEKLKSRGLVIDDEELAAKYLSNISYYRLRAYTYPFQDNLDPEKHHEFVRKDINFKDIIDLYCFDRRLRFLVFNALEKVDQALLSSLFRTRHAAVLDGTRSGVVWFLEPLVRTAGEG